MHEALRLYDTCLVLLDKEKEALDNQEEERLQEIVQQRLALMEDAWRKRDGCPLALLTARLQALQKAQNALTAKTRMQTETLRLELKNSRRESTRLTGYGKTLGNGQNRSLLRKEG